MVDDTLGAWLDEQERLWKTAASLPGETKPLFSERVFETGNEPPLLAALRGAYRPQETGSDCSLTSVTLLLDALVKEAAPHSEKDVLALVPEPDRGAWRDATRKGGSGVTFDELVRYATAAFGHYKLKVSHFQPEGDRATDTERFGDALRSLSLCPRSALLLHVDQGVFTGDQNAPHVTPVGGHDPDKLRVLILDVDPAVPSLYLSPVHAVMEAMARTANAEQGRLCGGRGGWVWITEPRSGS